MATNIDSLDGRWNPYESLKAMQYQRAQQSYQMYLKKHWSSFVQSWTCNQYSNLDRHINLKKLGLEETACIVDG